MLARLVNNIRILVWMKVKVVARIYKKVGSSCEALIACRHQTFGKSRPPPPGWRVVSGNFCSCPVNMCTSAWNKC